MAAAISGIIAASVAVAGVASNVVMAKQGADAAKKAGRTAREQQLADLREQKNAQQRANSAAENEALLASAQNQLAARNLTVGFAGQNAKAGISPQIILPVALGTVAVSLAVFMLARRKK